MKKYSDLTSLIHDIHKLHWEAWLYCDSKKWNENPLKTPFYYLEEAEVAERNEETGLPIQFENTTIKHFFEVETFRDIVSVFLANHIKKLSEAIQYYDEFDCFKE